MDIALYNSAVAELSAAISEIQQPRSDYALERFVVKQHDTPPMQWYQAVLEMQQKHVAIKKAQIGIKKLDVEISRLTKTGDELDLLNAEEKQIEKEQTELAILGAFREFECLYKIFKQMKSYSYSELQAAQTEYWHKRLIRQSELDIHATGGISVGNLDALRMASIGLPEPAADGGRYYPILEKEPAPPIGLPIPPGLAKAVGLMR